MNLYSAPFYYPGGETGCLLLHGFTGTPREVEELGAYLADRGHTVSGICLPGHGQSPGAMAGVGYRQWLDNALGETEKLLVRCKGVYVGGLSMGGAIALNIASRGRIHGVFTICSPVYLDIRKYMPRVLKYLQTLDKELWLDIRDPGARARHVGYDSAPLRSGLELLKLLYATKKVLPRVKVPAVIIQARTDRTVDPQNALLIHQSISSPDKRIVWLERSGHVATEDYDKGIVFEEIARFIKETSGG